jgi:hypothetical protein
MNELLAKLKNEGFLAEDLMHGHQHSTEVILVPIVKRDMNFDIKV